MAPRHTLIQLSDLHLRSTGGPSPAPADPERNLVAALAAIGEPVAPSALLLTGDLADDGAPATYRRLREILTPVARRLGAAVVPLMGNHDDRAALREHLLGEPADGAPLDRVVWLPGRAGAGPLRLILLDSTIPGRPDGALSGAQLDWLRAELATPAAEGSVLAMHHPPLPSPSRLFTAIGLRGRALLAAAVAGSDVRIVLAGHTHAAAAGVLAGVPVWSGGSSWVGADPVAPRGERLLGTCSLSRIDLFADGVLATAVPVGVPAWEWLSDDEVDARTAAVEGGR